MNAILIAALGLQGCLCLGAKPVYMASVNSIHCTLKIMCGMPQRDLRGIVPSQVMFKLQMFTSGYSDLVTE